MKSDNEFNTPVLLIVFNRLETTKKVICLLNKIKPPRLYIASDGPRTNVSTDTTKIAELRKYILANITWKCDTKTLFSEINLGCKNGPATAIRWFFDNEDQGIILEDDCYPDDSFFYYCQELLYRYKDDYRIGMISAFNGYDKYPSKYSYHFSTGGATFGWGSWSRVGKGFNPDHEILKDPILKQYLLNSTTDKRETEHFLDALKYIQTGNDQGWDFSWSALLKINSQLAIVPSVNLIENLSDNSEATHPMPANHPLNGVKVNKMHFPLKHPPFIVADREFSKKIAAQHFKPFYIRVLSKIPLLKKIYRIIKNK